jgi:hypothetical protein
MVATAVSVAQATRSDKVWFPFHIMLAGMIAIVVYLFVGRSIADPDIWWHLKNGQVFVQQHHWVRFDTYSYTVTGTPWINSEWLSEVLYYGAWKAWGFRGVFLLYGVMAELIMLGVLLLSYRASDSIKAAFLSTAVAVALAVVNFGPRTILFGWACMVVLLLILWQFMRKGSAPLWAVPIVFAFWINLHGSWLLGLIIYGMVLCSGLVEGSYGAIVATKWTWSQLRALIVAGVVAMAALMLNPYGYKAVFYPFDMAYRQKLNISHIEEWASLDFHEPRGKIFFVLLAGVLLLALARKRTWKLAEVAMVVFALYLSLTYVRFLFLGGILLAPILARQMDFVPPYKKEVDRSWLNAVIVAVLLGVIVRRFPSERLLEDDVAKKFPSGSIRFLQAHPGERVVNHYMYGGYMIWSVPAIPTFVDSRTDIFEYRGVLKAYLDMIGLKGSLDVLDTYRAHYVLFPKADPLSYLLRHNAAWKVAYEDEKDDVFERVDKQP